MTVGAKIKPYQPEQQTMSYLAKLQAVYAERLRLEQLDGYCFPDTVMRLREISELLIGAGVRKAEGCW
jgi:hypothetical protein